MGRPLSACMVIRRAQFAGAQHPAGRSIDRRAATHWDTPMNSLKAGDAPHRQSASSLPGRGGGRSVGDSCGTRSPAHALPLRFLVPCVQRFPSACRPSAGWQNQQLSSCRRGLRRGVPVFKSRRCWWCRQTACPCACATSIAAGEGRIAPWRQWSHQTAERCPLGMLSTEEVSALDFSVLNPEGPALKVSDAVTTVPFLMRVRMEGTPWKKEESVTTSGKLFGHVPS